MANFEPFHRVISSSINLLFLKSVAVYEFINSKHNPNWFPFLKILVLVVISSEEYSNWPFVSSIIISLLVLLKLKPHTVLENPQKSSI